MTLTRSDYTPAPFWFLNHRLEREELLRQLELMREQGIHSFFLHPRAGLLTPYGSEEWFSLVRFIVEEAVKRDMEVWLYDEDPYPSGAAGGRLLMDHPEYAAREIRFHEAEADADGHVYAEFGDGRLLEAWQVEEVPGAGSPRLTDISCHVGVLRRQSFVTLWQSSYYAQIIKRQAYPHYRAETFFPVLALDVQLTPHARVWAVTVDTVETDEKYGRLPDNLNRDAVKLFLKLTHEAYRQHVGDYFGRGIKGIFTDETAAGGLVPWTEELPEFFRRRHGYDLAGNYYKLFRELPGSDQARFDYWEAVRELFIDAFYRPVNDWCRGNGLQLTGHGIAEEDPTATTNGGNIYALQSYVGIPGFDHITCNIPDGKEFYSLNVGGRLVASAASQNGEHLVQSESMGCNAFNFNAAGMRKVGHWLYVLGVNWLVPHGFHYSYDGFRKDDAGKSFFFQDPEFPRFHRFAAYFGNLGYQLGEARATAAVCTLYPVRSFHRYLPGDRTGAERLRDRFYVNIQKLFRQQSQFEFADEDTLFAAPLSTAGIEVGQQRYRAVYVPVAELADATREALERLAAAGIPVFYPGDEDKLEAYTPFELESAPGSALEATQIMTLAKEDAEGRQLLYLFNNQDCAGTLRVRWRQPRRGVTLYDPENDSRQRLEIDASGAVTVAFTNYGAALLRWGDTAADGLPVYALPDPVPVTDYRYEQALEWDYRPPVAGIAATLRDWRVTVNGEERGVHRYSVIRDIAGTTLAYQTRQRPRAIFDTVAVLTGPYPAQVKFETEFSLPHAGFRLVMENESIRGAGEIYLNGQLLPQDCFRRERIYDPWNLVAEVEKWLRPGSNRMEIRWRQAGEFDGLTSLLYFL